MAGCGCKSNGKSVDSSGNKIKTKISIKNYVVKIILFSILVLISPIFLGIIIWVLFRVLILDKQLEILPLLQKFVDGNLFKKEKDVDEEDDNEEDDEEDEFIPINVEDVTNKYK